MFRMLSIPVIVVALAVPFFASAALGQTSPETGTAPESPPGVKAGGEVNGEFRLHLSGEVRQGYSFYMEASFGSGGEFLCTTDPAMVEVGYQECVAGVMTLPFVAPAGEEISYRILGNPGVELSQFVVSEGTVATSEGMIIDSTYEFPASEAPSQEEPVVEDQYQDGVDRPVIEADPVSLTETTTPESTVEVTPETTVEGTTAEETTGSGPVSSDEGGLLPQSGGFPVLLVGGVALLFAGGFVFRRAVL